MDKPLGLQEFLDSRHMEVTRFYAPTAFIPQEIPLVLINVRDSVDLRDIVQPKCLVSEKSQCIHWESNPQPSSS